MHMYLEVLQGDGLRKLQLQRELQRMLSAGATLSEKLHRSGRLLTLPLAQSVCRAGTRRTRGTSTRASAMAIHGMHKPDDGINPHSTLLAPVLVRA